MEVKKELCKMVDMYCSLLPNKILKPIGGKSFR